MIILIKALYLLESEQEYFLKSFQIFILKKSLNGLFLDDTPQAYLY